MMAEAVPLGGYLKSLPLVKQVLWPAWRVLGLYKIEKPMGDFLGPEASRIGELKA